MEFCPANKPDRESKRVCAFGKVRAIYALSLRYANRVAVCSKLLSSPRSGEPACTNKTATSCFAGRSAFLPFPIREETAMAVESPVRFTNRESKRVCAYDKVRAIMRERGASGLGVICQ
jgi:hypothetical protein